MMNRLFKSNSANISRSDSASSSSLSSLDPNILNSNQTNYLNNENDLFNWNIPRVSSKEIYKKGTFDFLTDFTIKTVEQTISLTNEHDSLQLLSTSTMLNHIKRKFNYLHIGLVQVAVKPLTRDGLNTNILLCLRDCRHQNFHDSLLSIVESTLCDGPVYFNCYPNFTIALRDPNILDTLTLNIKTNGFNLKEGSMPIALAYRIQYK